MRFLIVDTDYPSFLNSLYRQHPGLERQGFDEQLRARAQTFFGCAGAYPHYLKELGHEAHQVFFNNEYLQSAWAREHGLNIDSGSWELRFRRGFVPWLSKRTEPERRLYEVLTAQIKHYKPDVLINNDMHLRGGYFREMKRYCRLLIGSHGSPLPAERDWGAYDLVLSVVDNLVDCLRKLGLRSELLRLAFDPAVLGNLQQEDRPVPVSFVGQLTSHHQSRRRWMETVCQRASVQIWAPSSEGVPSSSPVMPRYRGEAWGMDMYKVLHRSRITLNHHIDVAGDYAGNSRLFEATGVGTLLVTDWKKNLHEMFEPGRELVAYRTSEECAEIIEYYLDHERERDAIARAGQQRTLRDHTFYARMQELAHVAGAALQATPAG